MHNYRHSGIYGRKDESGRWKTSTPEQDATLLAEVERNTAASLKAIDNFPGHEQTVTNPLKAANLRSRRAIPREIHKEEHIEECLVFVVGNDDQDWKKVIFSDEVTFSITKEGPTFVYRHPGTRFDQRTSTIRARSGRVAVSCWGGFLVVEWAQSHWWKIQPAEMSTVAETPYGSLC